MNIIVCIKQVPDTTEVRLDPATGTLIRDGVPSIINPDDKAGIEAALTLREEYNDAGIPSKVTVVTMGPAQADLALREALAMGCDEAALLTDRRFGGADTWATSLTLASYIRKLDYDIIITGRQAIDGDTAQVGPQLAEHLNLPQVTYAREITPNITNKTLTVKRMFEDGYHIVEVKPPCLITALSDMNKPRYMNVGGVFSAYRQVITQVGYDDIADFVAETELGLKGSPTRVVKSFTRQAKPKGEIFELDADDAVAVIVGKLREKHLI